MGISILYKILADLYNKVNQAGVICSPDHEYLF